MGVAGIDFTALLKCWPCLQLGSGSRGFTYYFLIFILATWILGSYFPNQESNLGP